LNPVGPADELPPARDDDRSDVDPLGVPADEPPSLPPPPPLAVRPPELLPLGLGRAPLSCARIGALANARMVAAIAYVLKV
jgi:hypothetical protein